MIKQIYQLLINCLQVNRDVHLLRRHKIRSLTEVFAHIDPEELVNEFDLVLWIESWKNRFVVWLSWLWLQFPWGSDWL